MTWIVLLLGLLAVVVGLTAVWGAPLVLPGAAIALLTGGSIHEAWRLRRDRT